MTKNNLAVHLKWLLNRGPSLYPSLAPDTHPRVEDRVSQQPTPPADELGLLDDDLLDDVDDVTTDETMARLLFAPESASKPRMLSRPDSLPQKTPSTSRKKSPPKQTSAVQGSKHEPPSSSYKKSRSKATPLRSEPEFGGDSPFGPVESIDLTGDVERALAKTEFGEPRRLWTEEAVSRATPVEKRGKKRKSDEYKSDLLSPSKHASKVRTPSKADRAPHSNGYSPSVSRTAGKTSSSSTVEAPQTGSPAPPRSHRKREIADSDDEDDPFDSWIDGIDEDDEMMADAISYPKLPEVIPTGNGAPNGPSASALPGDTSRKPLPRPHSSDQVKTIVVAKDSSAPQPTPWPKQSSSQEKPEDLVRFLALPPDSLVQSLTQGKNTLQKNAEVVYQQAMEGRPAPELIAENKTLVTQIQAIECLQTERDAHNDCISRREGLKRTLMTAISQGLDPTTMPEQLASSRAVETELEQIETRICSLLPQANLFESITGSRVTYSDSPLQSSHKEPTRPVSCVPDTSFSRPSQPASSSRTTFKPSTPRKSQSSFMQAKETNVDTSLFDYDNGCISRNMGSPPLDNMDLDEFDWDAGDDDILEAAASFEDHSAPVRERESQPRKVFAETSGNTPRAPTVKKSPGRSAFWSNHQWSHEVRTVLKDRFHLRGFRPNQLEAVDATLAGKDTFVLMPTGGGKSLCYQLPAVVTSGRTTGVTIVISPLLSLMQDQVSHLHKLNINAFLINGESDKNERQWIISQLSNEGGDGMELLYITPEMINKSTVLVRALEKLHRRQKLARIVIDEAHCVSQWGHDFRPDYKELGEIRAKFPGVPVMALTATATENVKVDVIHNLQMTGCEVFLQSFNRPNLTYEVRAKGKNDATLASIAETITRSYRNQCGIIYCLSRMTCEKVAKDLNDNYKIKAKHYHAAMKPDEKARVQNEWQMGRCHVIVATIAFGMGIDKPDVRFVVHHSIPKSLEGYYQETGRAGRDGKRSGCYLYYSYGDTATLKRMIDDGDGSFEQKARQKHMLRNVVQFCENRSDCRRVQVLAYFNEYFRREDCGSSCDNCKSDLVFEVQDFSQHASSAIKIVRHFQEELAERVTMLYCVDLLRGELKRAKNASHKQIPWYGNGSDLDRGEAERLFYRLLGEDALAEENVMNGKGFATQYVRLGRRAADFESGRRQMKLQVRVSPNGKTKAARPAQKPATAKSTQGYPQSTMVSSPIQSANDRRAARFKKPTVQADHYSEDDESDGFEPLRVAGKPSAQKTRELGPPITRDQKMDQLDHLHRAVAEDFEVTAKRYLQDIVVEKGLRCQPFPDHLLREMAISFPKDLSELSALPGIDQDKVKRYGHKMLRLVENAKRRYHELKQEEETNGIVPDPNHHNVINLSSSDEYSDDDLFGDDPSAFDLDTPVNNNTTGDITSRYFPLRRLQATTRVVMLILVPQFLVVLGLANVSPASGRHDGRMARRVAGRQRLQNPEPRLVIVPREAALRPERQRPNPRHQSPPLP
ncbi:hypothetical protein N7474_003226 [Penicillium riverlandense]|uniref:uncharacterized protein n=1 Tax=Penicillium riverlandense TaxID=1903569 RepID=UPI002547F6C2|nr:uncharacterized protein N7474_003226 [Penicillium riverlandense]KAJ5826088.1 hypothetical protein N7474_003226 [Penicillium riverlandense]